MILQDGANHAVDSSEWAFYQACQQAFNDVCDDGVWQILEPVMSVEVNSPQEFSSQIFSLINGRAGIITGQTGREDWFSLEAEVPLNNMFGFSAELRSLTQGKGKISQLSIMGFDQDFLIPQENTRWSIQDILQHLQRRKIRSLLSGIRSKKQLKLPVDKEGRKRRKIKNPLSFVGFKHNYCMLPFAFYLKIHPENKFF